MRRTRTPRALLSALLAGGALVAAGLLPATAADAQPQTDKTPASDGVLNAMQRDFGLSEQQAEKRLAAEKQARTTEKQARRAAGSAYAGSWFSPKTGKLTVAVADREKAAAVRGTGATVDLVDRTAAQLDAAKKAYRRPRRARRREQLAGRLEDQPRRGRGPHLPAG